jgi:hypothetical protein
MGGLQGSLTPILLFYLAAKKLPYNLPEIAVAHLFLL